MKKSLLVLTVMILALAACGGGGEPGSSAAENSVPGSAAAAGDTGAETESGAGDTVPAAGDVSTSGLAENFDGALTIMAQLALGTVQLDDTDLAVDKAQAAELLPLWQAVQSLSQSDTTAEIELQAVVKQISNTMTPEQIAAIASMKLTEDRVTELLQSGELGFSGFGRGAGAQGGSGNGRGFGGFGPPGGEFPGGGPGGFGGPGGGNFSEEDLATRRARFEGGGITEFQDRMLTGMVVRLLQDKLGIVSERQLQANIMNEAFTAVSEAAGLSVEQLREQTAAGQSLAEIVESNSGDVSALQASLEEIFGGLPNAADLDLPQATADWLGIAAGS